MKEICKMVLLAYTGENIVRNMNKECHQYIKVRKALDFCWEWIEYRQAEEELIYDLLDDEDEDDLVVYMIYEDNEAEKKRYSLILGIVSYIALNVLEYNKLQVPQFLQGTDEKYYESLIKEIYNFESFDYKKENLDKVHKYCKDKIKNNEIRFTKVEIMGI